jgi:hypothetical protein
MAHTAYQFTKDEMVGHSYPWVYFKWEFDVALQAKGNALPSFTSEHLESKYTPETEFLVKWTALSIYSGYILP